MDNLAAYAHLLNRIDKSIVLDFGSRYTKCGLASKNTPRYIIRSYFITGNGKTISLQDPSNASEQEWKESIEIFLRELFLKKMGLSKGYKIIILDSLLYSYPFRKALLYVLLNRFKFSSVKFFISEAIGLYSLIPKSLNPNDLYNTALIVDIGYNNTRILPIYEGIALIGKLQYDGVSSYHVLKRLQSLIMEYGIWKKSGKQYPTNECKDLQDISFIENIFIRICFSCLKTFREDSPPLLKYPPELKTCFNIEENKENNNTNQDKNINFIKEENERVPSVTLSLSDGSTLEICGYIRAHTSDILFENSLYYPSIAVKILDCLLNCEIDMRCELAYSIVLCGGIVALPGLITRVLEECTRLLVTPKYEKLASLSNHINIYSNSCKNPMISQWVGASLIGTLQETGYTITLDDYEKTDKCLLPNYIKHILHE